jgi:type IV secretion system protein VirD4
MEIWSENGGVYFGRQVVPPAPVHEERQSGEELSSVPTVDEPLRGEWREISEEIRYCGDRHLFTLGPNGSGKTRLLLLPNLVKLTKWSVFVIDPKGSLAAMTGPYRASLRDHTVRVIDPYGVLDPAVASAFPALKSRGFNPLAMLSPESDRFNDDAGNIARAMIKLDALSEKHWAQSAQALVKGLLMALRVEDGPQALLWHVRAIITAPTDIVAKECARIVKRFQHECPPIAAALNRFAGLKSDSRELMSILSTAQTQTEWLDSDKIRESLAGDGFEFGFMKERPTTVYLILPPEELESQSIWLRLMVAAALRPLLRSVQPARVPVLFMLDEFAQLGHMEVIEKNLGLMREYGVKLWPVLQDLGQMKDLYERRWESFIGNAGMLHAFAPQDATTREYLSKLSGERLYWTTVRTRSIGYSSGRKDMSGSGGRSESAQSHRGPVYWPQHLGAIRFGKAVLFHEGHIDRASFPQPEDMDDVRAAMNFASRRGVEQSQRSPLWWDASSRP